MTTRRLARRAPAAVRGFLALGRGGPPTRVQTGATVLVLLAMYVVSAVREGAFHAPGPGFTVVIVATWAPLLLRTAWPAVALLGTLVAESFILVLLPVAPEIARQTEGMGAYQPAPVATMVAVGTLAARVPPRVGWMVGAASGGWLALVGVTQNSKATYLTDLVLFYLVMTAAAVGVGISARRDRLRREVARREADTQQAVLDERLRIARELHDVLAHNLTLVNAQAAVADYLLPTDPGAARRALRDITAHTSRAIDDLRATIGLLRQGDDGRPDADAALRPVPGLADLDALVAAATATGATVRRAETGERVALAQHVDLAAYRIVQESVTNAAKHAPGSVVDVALAWTPEGVRLRIANDPAPGGPAAPGTGHGLIGMRERAATVGGTFRAGPAPDGRFEVVATLPAPKARPAPPHDQPGAPR